MPLCSSAGTVKLLAQHLRQIFACGFCSRLQPHGSQDLLIRSLVFMVQIVEGMALRRMQF